MVWSFPFLLEDPPLQILIRLVLALGLAGAIVGTMAGLTQWFLLRSRSTTWFPGRMVLFNTVAGSAGAMAFPLVYAGVLQLLFNVIKFFPPLLSWVLAVLAGLSATGAIYGLIVATAMLGIPSPHAGNPSGPLSSLRLPGGR